MVFLSRFLIHGLIQIQWVYIERPEFVTDAFGGALGGEKSIQCTDVVLSIACAPHVSVSGVFCGAYRHAVQTNEGGETTVQVFYPNLMAGEERDVLLVTALPSVPAPLDAFPLFTAQVAFTRLLSTVRETSPNEGSCTVRRVSPGAFQPSPRSIVVDVQLNRHLLNQASRSSLQAADANNFDEAQRTLRAAIASVEDSAAYREGNAKVVEGVTELKNNINNYANREIFLRGGGRAFAVEADEDASKQRKTYSKGDKRSAYQSGNSAGMQQKALSSRLG